jgi:branched-subunit amino acid transport protein
VTGISWLLVLALAAGAYGCKAVGLVVVGARRLPSVVDRCLALIPAALVSALVVKDTFSIGQELVIDARAAGVGAAILLAWRRAPLAFVIAAGAAVTALVRAAG